MKEVECWNVARLRISISAQRPICEASFDQVKLYPAPKRNSVAEPWNGTGGNGSEIRFQLKLTGKSGGIESAIQGTSVWGRMWR
ncbi:hypothetical protein KM043_014218 [Ampulex compressa]|nr:hypothetical protein KM043_014218 [Ampulex compressa]